MNITKFKPLYDRVLVLKDKQDDKTSGGIILLNKKGDEVQSGKIVATGDGRFSAAGVFNKINVLVGDVVYFESHVGAKVTIDGIDHLLMNEDELLAVQNKEVSLCHKAVETLI